MLVQIQPGAFKIKSYGGKMITIGRLFFNGLTIGELKQILEGMDDDGEVWLETRCGIRNIVNRVYPLNSRDIILEWEDER
jgi:hypothetical protein